MKKILIIFVVAIMQNTVFSNDIFEGAKPAKNRIKIISYEKLDGTIIQIDDINKNFGRIAPKKNKSDQLQSSDKTNKPSKYIYHRADNKTYVSTDLRDWKMYSDEKIPESDINIDTLKKVTVTPNPVVDYLRLQNLNGQKFEIYSMFGIKVMEGECRWEIDVNNLPPGIYLFKTEAILTKFIKI